MGNSYCCAYTDKPGEDFTIESKYIFSSNHILENNINIGIKFYNHNGNKGGDNGTRNSNMSSDELSNGSDGAQVSYSTNLFLTCIQNLLSIFNQILQSLSFLRNISK